MAKVAAYITSYEDSESLEKCLSCIFRQDHPVDEILIVDNSEKKVDVARLADNIIVKHHPENIGISGGLEIGVIWAIDQKYDFLWMFDQDSQPTEDCLSSLIDEYINLKSRGEQIGIIAPLSFDLNTGIELPGGVFDRYQFTSSKLFKEETYKCDVVITSGSLVSMEAAKHAELPNVDLFIDAVDWDYCMNLKKKGYGTFMTRKATMKHRFSALKLIDIPFTSRKITTNNYPSIRIYYICRNHTYIAIKSAASYFVLIAVAQRLAYLIKSSVKIIFFEKNKTEKVYLGFIGTFDGLRRKLGKRRQISA